MKGSNRRILVIDDDQEIWHSYRNVLLPERRAEDSPGHLMARLLQRGSGPAFAAEVSFEMAFASQGAEGFAMVEEGLAKDNPYAVAFIDIRMPPGWDGMKTAARIRRIDPAIEIVIVTAFSDYYQEELVRVVGAPDKLLFFRKPFDADELKQIAISLTEKWNIGRQEEEQRRDLQTIFRTTPAAIFTVAPDRTILTWNPAAAEITGYSENQVMGHPCPFGGVLNGGRCHQCLMEDPGTTEAEKTREFRFQDRQGRMRTILIRLARVVDRHGQMVKAVESFWDITSLKEAEIALHDSEERFRALVETTSDWVWEIDREGRFTYCSPLCQRIYGHTPAELMGRKFFEALAVEEERSRLTQLFAGCVVAREGFQSVIHCYRHKDGQPRFVETSAVPVLDGKGELIGFRGIDRDITERKRNEEERAQLEEQYRQSQKIESLGILAGGIAHDLNNVLTPIICNAELAKMLLQENHPARKNLVDIIKCADRAADLIRRILAFSRKQVLKPRALDLNHLAQDLGKIMRRLIREDIAMEFDLDAELQLIDADPGQMEQILINLAVNASDALAANGRIIIRTRNETVLSNTLFDINDAPIEGPFVVLSVSDNGTGIDKETIKHIFEPFFTTKAVGKGTGMGLSTVYGIIQQHRGHIRIETALGEGSTFFVYLPPATRQEEDKEKDQGEPIVGGNETVLVVEDDTMVRSMLINTLQNFGYRVIEATNGHEAVQAFGIADGGVDLLITDVIMPGMHGDQVVRELRKTKPSLPVIYISGYTLDMGAKDLEIDGNAVFISKPFRPASIAREVRRQLDKVGKLQ